MGRMTTIRKLRARFVAGLLCVLSIASQIRTARGAATNPETPNVLLIIFDDLRTTVGAYNDSVAWTPNLDAFFAESVQFNNMHASKSECAPSRVSMLAGQRPDRLRIWSFEPKFRTYNPSVVTLPGHFLKAGYRAVALGKIYDNRSFYSSSSDEKDENVKIVRPVADICTDEDPDAECSWSSGVSKQTVQVNTDNICNNNGTEMFPGSGENPYAQHAHIIYNYADELIKKDMDYCMGSLAVAQLQELAEGDDPFFLAVGIAKPHLPWVVPQSIANHYGNISDAEFEPTSYPSSYWKSKHLKWSHAPNKELESYTGWNSVSVADRARGYYGAVSFGDQQVGRILTQLDSLEAANNTFVVFWGDHGFHLGDRDLWGKKTVFEQSTRVPFGIRPSANWLAANPDAATNGIGAKVQAPTDSVDILPTILDLCNLTIPAQTERAGTSLVPLMKDPTSYVRSAAVSQFEAYGSKSRRGYSIRSTNYRLIVYLPKYKVYKSSPTSLPYRKKTTKARQALFYYETPGQVELVDRINSAAHATAYKDLLKLYTQNADRDWTHLIGVEPFDHPSNR